MEKIAGGVTAAKGFSAAHTAAGIKYQGREDMALIYSSEPCQTAGTFTSNVVKAAPVKWDRKLVEESAYTQAIVVSAGIASACPGEEGMEYCRRAAECAGKELDIPADAVLVASTGVIGMQLPMDRICEGIRSMAPQLSEELAAGNGAA